jgi:hypothetical protein
MKNVTGVRLGRVNPQGVALRRDLYNDKLKWAIKTGDFDGKTGM